MSESRHREERAEASALVAAADATAAETRRYLDTVREVAAGSNPDAAISLLLLALSELLAAGARLGAITDVVPPHRFEPDDGPEPDMDALRGGLANALEGLDDYMDISDPGFAPEAAPGSLSSDLAQVAMSLATGLQHYEAGERGEALWWWQFSYLSVWGERAAAALRVLIELLAHARLDVADDVAAEAEFEALYP